MKSACSTSKAAVDTWSRTSVSAGRSDVCRTSVSSCAATWESVKVYLCWESLVESALVRKRGWSKIGVATFWLDEEDGWVPSLLLGLEARPALC